MSNKVQTIQERLEAAAYEQAKEEASTLFYAFTQKVGSDILYQTLYRDESGVQRNGYAILENIKLAFIARRRVEVLEEKVKAFLNDFEKLRARIEELESRLNQ